MISHPLVSILVPVFNAEKVIGRCLESIRAQTYREFEVIVINDGSTDKTPEILNHFSAVDERFKVLHKKNNGVSEARNCGINEACGIYICFIDADDYVTSDYVEKLLKPYSDSNVDLVVSGYCELSPLVRNPILLHDFHNHFPEKVLSKKQFQANLFKGLTGVLWAKMFKKEIIDRHGLRLNPEISYSEDMIFVLRYSNAIRNVRIIYDNLYYYDRSNENGLSSKIDGVFLKNLQLSNEEIERHYIGADKKDIIRNRFRVGVINLINNIAAGDFTISEKKNRMQGLWNEHRFQILDNSENKIPVLELLEKRRFNQIILLAVLKKKILDIKKRLK